MIIRVVRMTFHEDKVEEFLEIFNASKHKIRDFDGCEHLELWKDEHQPHIMMTYSYWISEEHLNVYRHSELFKTTWSKTKKLFADKPQAFSSQRMDLVVSEQ